MERLEFDLLFRWFVGLGIDDRVWDHSVFSKNRERLLEAEIAARFLTSILNQGEIRKLLSDEHFSVDGTLVEAWASLKSFRPQEGQGWRTSLRHHRDGNEEVDFRGEKRSNQTHASTTDPDARLYRKGSGMEAKLSFIAGHALMENRNRPLRRGTADRMYRVMPRDWPRARYDRALCRAEPLRSRCWAATKGFDAADFIMELREINVTPHVAQNTTRRSAIDRRTTRHPGYDISQRVRKRI